MVSTRRAVRVRSEGGIDLVHLLLELGPMSIPVQTNARHEKTDEKGEFRAQEKWGHKAE